MASPGEFHVSAGRSICQLGQMRRSLRGSELPQGQASHDGLLPCLAISQRCKAPGCLRALEEISWL
jgi:hypothetical protein